MGMGSGKDERGGKIVACSFCKDLKDTPTKKVAREDKGKFGEDHKTVIVPDGESFYPEGLIPADRRPQVFIPTGKGSHPEPEPSHAQPPGAEKGSNRHARPIA
jgi:hypothetical protein